MKTRIDQLIEYVAQLLLQRRLAPVPVSRMDGLPQSVQRALMLLEERHERGEISDADYVRQLGRLTGR